eukprot:scaffold330110_cov119-Cyclotella_meneghiniana.AAC.1
MAGNRFLCQCPMANRGSRSPTGHPIVLRMLQARMLPDHHNLLPLSSKGFPLSPTYHPARFRLCVCCSDDCLD